MDENEAGENGVQVHIERVRKLHLVNHLLESSAASTLGSHSARRAKARSRRRAHAEAECVGDRANELEERGGEARPSGEARRAVDVQVAVGDEPEQEGHHEPNADAVDAHQPEDELQPVHERQAQREPEEDAAHCMKRSENM